MSQAAIPDQPTELQVKLREQRSQDLKAIRDAIVEDIENFDTIQRSLTRKMRQCSKASDQF